MHKSLNDSHTMLHSNGNNNCIVLSNNEWIQLCAMFKWKTWSDGIENIVRKL